MEEVRSSTGGVKAFPIEDRWIRERERLVNMKTPEQRAFRAQWLKDQHLAPHEPVHVPEIEKELMNPIRRFYRYPLDKIFAALEPALAVALMMINDYVTQRINRLPEVKYRKDIHSYSTRNSLCIDIPYCRLAKSLNSYEVLGLRLYNELPLDLTCLTLNSFKIKMYERLVVTPVYSIQEYFDWNKGSSTPYIRYFTGKAFLSLAVIYSTVYYFKYNSNDWTRHNGWRMHTSKRIVYPDEPGYPVVSTKNAQNYHTRGFENSPI